MPVNSTQSFLRGVASILDFGDTLTPRLTPTDTPEVWDALALQRDFYAVGSDLFTVVRSWNDNGQQLELPLGSNGNK